MNTPSPITALLLANVVANVVADVIATDAFAQAAPAQGAPGFGEMLTSMLPMFAIVFLIFYTLVFKPQQKKVKECPFHGFFSSGRGTRFRQRGHELR